MLKSSGLQHTLKMIELQALESYYIKLLLYGCNIILQ